jgi:O-antigen ligase
MSIATLGAMYFWRSPHKARTAAAMLLAAALILPVLPQQYWDRMATITASAEERDDSQTGRLYFWQVATTMAKDHPVFGVGHHGYEPAYDEYDSSLGRYGSRRSVHSVWFGVLAESGFPGLLLYIAIVLSSWFACVRVRRAAQRGAVSSEIGAYATALESGLVAFMVGGTFVPFQYIEMLWHYFGLTIALERVAMHAEAEARARATTEQSHAAPAPSPETEFVWG